MKKYAMRVGMLVYDRWWPWKVYRVIKILKTRVKLIGTEKEITFDNAHLQFLEKVTKRAK